MAAPRSRILETGQLPWGSLPLSGWAGLRPESFQTWTPCVKETFLPENNTLVRKVLTGGEGRGAIEIQGCLPWETWGASHGNGVMLMMVGDDSGMIINYPETETHLDVQRCWGQFPGMVKPW